MDASKDWANTIRTWLDTLGEIIPFYNAYREREARRMDDKIYREFLVDKLDNVKDNLQKIMKNPRKLDTLKLIDPIYKTLQSVQDRIRFASYGYTGFFDRQHVDAPELDKLLAYDHSLFQFVTSLDEISGKFPTTVDESISLNEFSTILAQFEDALEARKHYLEA
jgi:hypothetical protein